MNDFIMTKIRCTKCEICKRKFRGKLGVRMHERMKHRTVIKLLRESSEYAQKFAEKKFLEGYERSIIPYEDRMTTLASIQDSEWSKFVVILEWEKSKLREIPSKHPIFKEWTFRSNPWSLAIEVFCEALAFMACEYADCWYRSGEIVSSTDIDVIVDKVLDPKERPNFFDFYYDRKFWIWPNTYTAMDFKIHKFIEFILKTRHTRVIITAKIRQGDGVMLMGNPDRYGPKNIESHMSKYTSRIKSNN